MSGISDPDSGALKGLAISSADNSHGTWQYSLDNGDSWVDVGTLSLSSALLLPSNSDSRLRFVPDQDFNGSSVISYVAWDQTAGTPGDLVDIHLGGSRGGSTAFSTKMRASSIAVTPVNDAPVLGGLGGSADYVRGGAAATIAPTATVADVDSADFDTGVLLVRIIAGKDGTEQLDLGSGFSVDASNQVFRGATMIGVRNNDGHNGLALSQNFSSPSAPPEITVWPSGVTARACT